MPKISTIAKPPGSSQRYQYFLNEDTGKKWKAAVELISASPVAVDDVELSPTVLAASVTVSPVDDQGKALQDAEGLPIVMDSWTHSFTAVEMAEAGFDPQARVFAIVNERIGFGEAKLAGNEKIKQLADAWAGRAMLKAPTAPTSGKGGQLGGPVVP